jgi:hypothetical protein
MPIIASVLRASWRKHKKVQHALTAGQRALESMLAGTVVLAAAAVSPNPSVFNLRVWLTFTGSGALAEHCKIILSESLLSFVYFALLYVCLIAYCNDMEFCNLYWVNIIMIFYDTPTISLAPA